MIPKTQTPRGCGGEGALGKLSEFDQANLTLTPEAAQCGKRAAITAYCNGWLSLESCEQLFRTNPEWRHA